MSDTTIKPARRGRRINDDKNHHFRFSLYARESVVMPDPDDHRAALYDLFQPVFDKYIDQLKKSKSRQKQA